MQAASTKNRGFTLVEVLVATAMFTIIMVVLGSVMANMTAAHARTRGLRMALDNASTALEYMTREVRYGSLFHCNRNIGNLSLPRDCPNGDDSIVFNDSVGNQITYYLDGQTLYKVWPSGDLIPLNEVDEFRINSFIVSVDGAEVTGDTIPPMITFRIQGEAGPPNRVVSFLIQTSVEGRIR